MRKLMLMTCLFLAAGAAAADTKAAVDHGPQPTLEQMMQARAADPRFEEAESSRPLFFRLPDGAGEVEFLVSVGSHPYLRETVRATAGATVEFLARDPARLERLYRLAANKAVPVTITAKVGGATAREFSLADFVAYNRDLKTSGLRPVAGESTLEVLAPEPPARAAERPAAPRPDGPCEDQCYDDYLWCTQYYCDPEPIPYAKTGPDRPYCEYCYNEYRACLAACQPPPCTDPKSVTTYSTTELIGISVLYWDCFKRWWDPNSSYGDWYEALRLTYKITTYRRTEYCNGSVVIEVIGVSYGYAYCNHPLYITCFNPFWYPYNVCY